MQVTEEAWQGEVQGTQGLQQVQVVTGLLLETVNLPSLQTYLVILTLFTLKALDYCILNCLGGSGGYYLSKYVNV